MRRRRSPAFPTICFNRDLPTRPSVAADVFCFDLGPPALALEARVRFSFSVFVLSLRLFIRMIDLFFERCSALLGFFFSLALCGRYLFASLYAGGFVGSIPIRIALGLS